MGLFGTTKTKTFVGTSVSPVMTEDTYDGAVKQAIFSYIGGSSKRLSSGFQGSLLKGIASKMASYYRYGTETYLYGAPKGSVLSPSSASAEVKAAIEDELSATVTLDYSVFGFLNYAHLAWKEVDDVYGYDAMDNTLATLTALKGSDVFLDAVHVKFPEDLLDELPPEAFSVSGGPAITVTSDAGATAISVTIDYHYVDLVWDPGTLSYIPGTLIDDSEVVTTDLTVPDYEPQQDFFHARYIHAGQTHYWVYRLGDGTHPDLDSYFDSGFIENGSYYPWIYFRFGGIQGNADTDSDWYKHSRYMCNKLGLGFDTVANAIAENPNIGEVLQAILWFAVPPTTDNKAMLKYLWAYFSEAYITQGGELTALTRAEFKADFADSWVRPYTNLIQDARFKMGLGHSGIWKRLVTGSLGPVGTIQASTDTFAVKGVYINDTGGVQNKYTRYTMHYYSKQISATEYEEIQVLELSTRYNVYQFYWSIGDGDENQAIVLIPLDRALMDTLSFKDRDEVFSRGMQLVFNSMVQIKVDWYEQPWFQFIMIVVAVVITILSVGEAAKPMADLLALLSAGKIQAAFKLLFKLVLKRVLIMKATRLIIKELGLEGALALVASVVAFTLGGITAKEYDLNIPKLDDWILITMSLIKETSNYVQELQINIQSELAALDTEYAAKMDKLADLDEELHGGAKWAHYLIDGETPESFLARSLSPADMQVLLSSADAYIDRMLRLPKPFGV